jgi:hypothetical protein
MITVTQAAKKLRISAVRLRQLLLAGRIAGAQRFGRAWAIPDKPVIDPPLMKKHRRKKRKGTKHGRAS